MKVILFFGIVDLLLIYWQLIKNEQDSIQLAFNVNTTKNSGWTLEDDGFELVDRVAPAHSDSPDAPREAVVELPTATRPRSTEPPRKRVIGPPTKIRARAAAAEARGKKISRSSKGPARLLGVASKDVHMAMKDSAVHETDGESTDIEEFMSEPEKPENKEDVEDELDDEATCN